MRFGKHLFIAVLATVMSLAMPASAQQRSADGLWQDVESASIAARGERLIRPQRFRSVALNDAALGRALAAAQPEEKGGPGVVLSLPMPDGSFARYKVYATTVMAPELAKRYPEIRTYAGYGIEDPASWVRLDRTPGGFHAMIHTQNGSVYIDPFQRAGGKVVDNVYQSYAKMDLRRGPGRAFKCDVHDHKPIDATRPQASRIPIGPTLRTYRLAVATTGEYASFHGGTVPLVLAEIVTAINRVNGLYESQLGVRLVLIPNNDQLIFLNAATDGYTNNNGSAMLTQNQTRVDTVIGAGNYDIGHVFSTGGGGIAGLGVVCRFGLKARGVTGLPSPVGDPFYVDFVAHEIGHQFGANHSFNGTAGACGAPNRNGPTAYEPGSGSTIMAYAGICSSHNIASASDDHFHTISFDEIVNYTQNSLGNGCAVQTSTGNQAPIVDAGSGFTVPLDTPLRLTGSAVDPDGDTLVYRWEQFDLGPGGSPNAPSGNAPLFRSFPAETDGTRVLPRLNDILTNSQTIGERLPTYARAMRFRLTALDQRLGGGGVDEDDVTHIVTDQAGPFDMTSQNITTFWTPFETETITWDVAGTDQAPVNCAAVNILFSSDLGNTFPVVLAGSTPNDGSEDIVVPNIQTNIGRVMVECADNIFFDINNVNITVLEPPNPDFFIDVVEESIAACAPDSGVVTVDVQSIVGFTGPVTLSTSGTPAGVTSLFDTNPVNAGQMTSLSLGNLGAATPGDYDITVIGNGSTGTRDDTFMLQIGPGLPAAPTGLMPMQGAVSVPTAPTLSWAPAADATGYFVEISLDSGFNNIVYSANEATTSHLVISPLDFGTVYFWRVTAENLCGGSVSDAVSFTTVNGPEVVCAFPNAAIPEAGAPLSSSVVVGVDGIIVDVNIIVDASHGASGHLIFDIENEATGTTVGLLDQPGDIFFPGGCPTPDVDTVFDDEGAFAAEETCNAIAPGIGPNVQPDDALSAYDGQSPSATWTLTASDGQAGTTGVLNQWCVEIFYEDLQPDTDEDGIPDDADNCTLVPNPDQRDSNGDGFGNVCDADLNNDLVINVVDLGLLRAVFFTADADADFNGDGVVNVVDLGIMRAAFFGPPGPSGTQ